MAKRRKGSFPRIKSMKFGQYSIIDGFTMTFEKHPDWSVTFRAPTTKDDMIQSNYLNSARNFKNVDGNRVEVEPNWTAIAVQECAVLMKDSTIKADGETEYYFKPSDTVEIRIQRLMELPHEMVMEMWRAIGKNIPNWGMAVQPTKDA